VKVINELYRVRPYRWGAIYAFDHDAEDFPEDSIDSEGAVWATPRWITIGVRHAFSGPVPDGHPADMAVPLVRVELLVRVQAEPVAEARYDEVIEVPSGILNIGDANENDDVELQPGRWRMQINLDPPAEATKVDIVLSYLSPLELGH
jgi:hypothetical protein